jgi:hypothetical protein
MVRGRTRTHRDTPPPRQKPGTSGPLRPTRALGNFEKRQKAVADRLRLRAVVKLNGTRCSWGMGEGKKHLAWAAAPKSILQKTFGGSRPLEHSPCRAAPSNAHAPPPRAF